MRRRSLHVGQRFGRQFVVFQLILHLDGALEDGLQGGHDHRALRLARLEEQAVAPVFDVGDHAVGAWRHGIVRVIGGLLVFRPVAALGIEDEAVVVFVLAPHPAEIDAPERRGMAVGELGQRCRPAFTLDRAQVKRRSPVLLGEAHRRADLVAQAHALLFVRIDLVAPPGRDVLQAEEMVQRRVQRRAAVFTQIEALAVARSGAGSRSARTAWPGVVGIRSSSPTGRMTRLIR